MNYFLKQVKLLLFKPGRDVAAEKRLSIQIDFFGLWGKGRCTWVEWGGGGGGKGGSRASGALSKHWGLLLIQCHGKSS